MSPELLQIAEYSAPPLQPAAFHVAVHPGLVDTMKLPHHPFI